MPVRAKITATGSYLPAAKIDNTALTQFPPGSIPLIERKTGIRSRRHADPSESTSDLAIRAASACLAKAGCTARDLDAILLATSSPDRLQPATATRVQFELGAEQAFAFDINSVCSGAVYALAVADSFLRTGFCNHILLIASEVYSRLLNPQDFSTYPYFGDGAGAVLLSRTEEDRGVLHTLLKTDGSGSEIIQIPAGGTLLPCKAVTRDADLFFKMNGKAVFDFATTRGVEIIVELLRTSGISRQDIRYFILHQANSNILSKIAEEVGVSFDRFAMNVAEYGNTAAASVLIALDEVLESKNVCNGDYLVLAAFGGGLSWGASLIRI